MNVVVAGGSLLDEIVGLTFEIWNEGLTARAYSQWNAAQLRTPWGRANLHRLALVDDAGGLLATAKRYRFRVRLDGRTGWMSGIGAVFTPPTQRGRGYASQLVERLLEMERRDGSLLAGLFSEIDPAFYQRLGFASVPIDEVTVRVERRDGAPAILVRAGDERDLPALEAMDRVRSSGARFALDRDRSMIQYAVAKKRLLAGLGPVGLRQVEFVVAEEGASAVAYALLHENANGWTLEEAGDRDPCRRASRRHAADTGGTRALGANSADSCLVAEIVSGASADLAHRQVGCARRLHGQTAGRHRDAREARRRLLLAQRLFLARLRLRPTSMWLRLARWQSSLCPRSARA